MSPDTDAHHAGCIHSCAAMFFLARAAALPRRLALAATKHPSPCAIHGPAHAAPSPPILPTPRWFRATSPQIPDGPEVHASDSDGARASEDYLFEVDEEIQSQAVDELKREQESGRGEDASGVLPAAEPREQEPDSSFPATRTTHLRNGTPHDDEFDFEDYYGDKPPWKDPEWSRPLPKVSVWPHSWSEVKGIRHTHSKTKRLNWIWDYCRLSAADQETRARLSLIPPLAISPMEFKLIDSTKALPKIKTSRIYIANYPKKRTSEILGMLGPNVIDARAIVEIKTRRRYIIARYPTTEEARSEAMRFHNFEYSNHVLKSDFFYGDTKPYPSSLIRFDDVHDESTIQGLRDAFKNQHPHADTERIGKPHAVVLSGRAEPDSNMALTWYKPGNERSVAFVANVRRRTKVRKGDTTQTVSTRYPNFHPTVSYLRPHLSPIVKVASIPADATELDLLELFGMLVPVRAVFLSDFHPGEALIEVATLADAYKAEAFDNYRYGGKYLEAWVLKRSDRSPIKAEALQQHALPFAPSDKLSEYPRALIPWALLRRRPIPTFGVPNPYAVPPDEGKITPEMIEPVRPSKQNKVDWDLYVENSEKVRPGRRKNADEPDPLSI